VSSAREEYRKEIDQVFSPGDPQADRKSMAEISGTVELKREIEAAPEWPTNATNGVQVAVGAAVSNAAIVGPILFSVRGNQSAPGGGTGSVA